VEITQPDACMEAMTKAGPGMRGELNTYLTGTLAGAGSFRCEHCGFAVALNALEEVPECPTCGNARFARASIFDVHAQEEMPAIHDADDPSWLENVRADLPEDGQYLVHRDEGRVSVVPLVAEWIRIGRSLTADIRLDDPTVSRRHAIIAHQSGAVRVLDDRSLNGLFLNGERVEWGLLDDGDEIIIGRYRLFFVDATGASSEAAEPTDRAAA
jgi:FHA domain/Zinc-ribbon containing domain